MLHATSPTRRYGEALGACCSFAEGFEAMSDELPDPITHPRPPPPPLGWNVGENVAAPLCAIVLQRGIVPS